jgi:hypothetical protein
MALWEVVRKDWRLRRAKAAVRKLTSQVAIADVVSGKETYPGLESEVIEFALGRLTDQALLADIAQKHHWANARAIAAERLTDQALLANIAKNDGMGFVRIAAVGRLTDQPTLADIAREDASDRSGDVREAAVGRLADQAAIADVAMNNSGKSVRLAAVQRLIDQAALAAIARTNDIPDVRAAALKRIADEGVRSGIASADVDESVRQSIRVSSMSDGAMLGVLREFCSLLATDRSTTTHEGTVRAIGEELYRRGKEQRMADVLRKLASIPQYRRIECLWEGIGYWRG